MPRCIRLAFLICLFLLATGLIQAQEPSASVLSGAVIDELSLKDTDITEALSLISRKSGLNIIAGRNVDGAVTVFLKNVDAKEALRTVAEASGLAFADEGHIIRFMTMEDFEIKYGHPFGQEKVTRVIKLNFVPVRDLVLLLSEMKSAQGKVLPNEENKSVVLIDSAEKVKIMEALVREVDVQTVTSVIPLRFTRAEAVLEEVRGMVTQSVGGITCDTKGNRLLVTDTMAKVEKIRKFIEVLDARARKVIVQARLVHVVLNEEHLGGVDWEGIVSDFQRLSLKGAADFMKAGVKNAALSLGTIAEDEFTTLFEALDTVGLAKEYPLSDVPVASDEEARLVVRLDEPYITLDALKTSEATSAVTAIEGEASVEFLIKPVVEVDGSVRSTITPSAERGQPRPAVIHSKAADMIVVGNLIATEEVLTARKVPLMGDLPLLGFAFRYHNSSIRREEFVVFLTVKAVSPEEPLLTASGEPGQVSDAPVTPENKAP